ncbi:MAG: toll/interleukin-1 receptor domain-containing protein [Gemmatimonadetes bacterium]|uniref:Toll/interleukin-1 receptor domain-containing protein n=1 Tax=Candidatus Kutchimonas denitrificans TaxID=3056748 RepID=A0AAE4Z7E9_9BACT|nr:toll/interleukin-1 receptor domain-containing protein [Gemmatimonadota bacterium]NIR74082.1 toll/interleukin-1 receptor domain-containing protein [Candidatus Kutchimonas denitrificans]NIS01644.1 toll/interleukin-1 receptor domain-containing protein [Gemmatimonadota bacterium]NIT67382.1 toll/interleukin-1 receptor domain-containing protein [Gemmatimonadota bacterium]NIU52745.1 TIR domain-containing protein [Gemmatimonadota bacterium]
MPLVFISYASDDEAKAVKLARALRRAKDIDVWIDIEQIEPADDFLDKMTDGIKRADKFIVCLSPAFTSRPPTSWVRRELKQAIVKEVKSGQLSIIPVRLLKGGEIPDELGTRAYADLSTRKRWKRNLPRLIKAIRK